MRGIIASRNILLLKNNQCGYQNSLEKWVRNLSKEKKNTRGYHGHAFQLEAYQSYHDDIRIAAEMLYCDLSKLFTAWAMNTADGQQFKDKWEQYKKYKKQLDFLDEQIAYHQKGA